MPCFVQLHCVVTFVNATTSMGLDVKVSETNCCCSDASKQRRQTNSSGDVMVLVMPVLAVDIEDPHLVTFMGLWEAVLKHSRNTGVLRQLGIFFKGRFSYERFIHESGN